MGLFKQLEGDVAVLVANGVYKQTSLFTRDGYLYAQASGGFVRLNEDGSTSQPKMRLEHLDITVAIGRDRMGRLVTEGHPNFIPCDERKEQLLLGGKRED